MGDPPECPLPKIDGNPFTLLLGSQMEKEKVRCEAWKDEVQNLLITSPPLGESFFSPGFQAEI